MPLTRRTYDDAMEFFMEGDLLLCECTHPIARAICTASISRYSHAGMLVRRADCGWAVLDVLQWRGGGSRPLTKAIEKNPGKWHHYTANAGNRWDWDRAAAVERMWKFDDCDYGWGELLASAFIFLPGIRLFQHVEKFCIDDEYTVRNGDPTAAISSPFCSMGYDIAAQVGGVDPVPNLRSSQTTPGDLSRSLFFEGRSILYPSNFDMANAA